MIKALKVVMIIWSAVAILLGLVYIFFPIQFCEMAGQTGAPAWVAYVFGLLGICYITAGAFVIVAARNPLKHIMWVQFAITVAILIVVMTAISIMRGIVTFGQEATALIFNAVFAALLLGLYPYKAAKGK